MGTPGHVSPHPGRFEEVSSLAASSGPHRVVAKGEPLRPFSSAECVAYAKFLNAWHAIPAVLGGEVVVQSVACVNGCAHVKVTGTGSHSARPDGMHEPCKQRLTGLLIGRLTSCASVLLCQ